MLNLVIKINLLNLKGVNDKKTFGVRISETLWDTNKDESPHQL